MGRHSTYNILMYSHDTFGLGHIRRTMAIADNLRGRDINILILTGSPIAGRFPFQKQVDFVRIPGMIKVTNEEYHSLSIKINAGQALNIRTSIITTTAKTFQPNLFIIDKEPLGLKKEVLPALKWMRRKLPGSRTILGLRDIMDDAPIVQRDWKKKGIYAVLESLYSEIWVYGNREIYDPIAEYAIPPAVIPKMYFTGYIPRKIASPEAIAALRRDHDIAPAEKLVVITIGGGGDGYQVIDTFLTLMEDCPADPPFKSIIVTGPFLPRKQLNHIVNRARRLNIRAYRFFNKMEKLLAAADLVISMGGYNTFCEILSQKSVALLIPREAPRREQLIRAQVFKSQGLLDYVAWNEVNPARLRAKIEQMLANRRQYETAMAAFELTGLKSMKTRIAQYRKTS